MEVARKIEAKLALGEMNLEEKKERIQTFKEYAKKWLAITVPASCKNSTVRDYKTILNKHVLPVFGNMELTSINRMMVKEFLMKKLNSGYSQSTVSHFRNAISGIFNLALDNEIIQFNPAQKLGKFLTPKERTLTSEPLNREDLSLLLETFRAHFPKHYPLTLILARTGMRVGEAMALKWGDVDFNGRFITVQRGLTKWGIETPKSGKFRRVDI